MGHPDRNPDRPGSDAAGADRRDWGLFPQRPAEDARPGTFAAALIPDPSRDVIGWDTATKAVVLEWHAPDPDGAPGRARAGFFEVMASAATLESAIKLAGALNETNA